MVQIFIDYQWVIYPITIYIYKINKCEKNKKKITHTYTHNIRAREAFVVPLSTTC